MPKVIYKQRATACESALVSPMIPVASQAGNERLVVVMVVVERVVLPAPGPFSGSGRWEGLPYLGLQGSGGKWAVGHPLGTTWRWGCAGAGGMGQPASAAWSRPGWLGSPRLWGSG